MLLLLKLLGIYTIVCIFQYVYVGGGGCFSNDCMPSSIGIVLIILF